MRQVLSMSHDAVAREMNLSKDAVRRIEHEAFRKIRVLLRNRAINLHDLLVEVQSPTWYDTEI